MKYKKCWMVIKEGERVKNTSTGTSIYLRKADAIKLQEKYQKWGIGEYYLQEFDLVPVEDTK